MEESEFLKITTTGVPRRMGNFEQVGMGHEQHFCGIAIERSNSRVACSELSEWSAPPDPLSSVVGSQFGRHKDYLNNRK